MPGLANRQAHCQKRHPWQKRNPCVKFVDKNNRVLRRRTEQQSFAKKALQNEASYYPFKWIDKWLQRYEE
jgi:hypothetical protein